MTFSMNARKGQIFTARCMIPYMIEDSDMAFGGLYLNDLTILEVLWMRAGSILTGYDEKS
jgi:hypothetical protein